MTRGLDGRIPKECLVEYRTVPEWVPITPTALVGFDPEAPFDATITLDSDVAGRVLRQINYDCHGDAVNPLVEPLPDAATVAAAAARASEQQQPVL